MTIAFNHLGKLGQLGNQMFQYAATRGVASKTGVPFMIPNHRDVNSTPIYNNKGEIVNREEQYRAKKYESLDDSVVCRNECVRRYTCCR